MQTKSATTIRPPIVVVLGHVDHGKSSLLDYIRKSNTVLNEHGGITQHIGAYEIQVEDKNLTFIDTPGHAAFSAMRKRGAAVADVAILVVAADDGVKPQTLEALFAIEEAHLPYIVAINKIDKQDASTDKTKQGLAEAGIFVEGYGGNIPAVEISAKTGTGVDELLSLILLQAELLELVAESTGEMKGVVVESHRDLKRGVTATIIVTNGTLHTGDYILASGQASPVRALGSFVGKKIASATFSSPVVVSGFYEVPAVGETVRAFKTRKEAEAAGADGSLTSGPPRSQASGSAPQGQALKDPEGLPFEPKLQIPIVLKADTLGTLEAIESELKKGASDKIKVTLVVSGVGTITESDVKHIMGATKPVIIGFNVNVDKHAKDTIDKNSLNLQTFNIIYKLTEWFENYVAKQTPKDESTKIITSAKILKTFSSKGTKHIVGGKVEDGEIKKGSRVSLRRGEEILGEGRVTSLQHNKIEADTVSKGDQFGACIETKVAIIESDLIEISE